MRNDSPEQSGTESGASVAAYVGLGSNTGDSRRILRAALDGLGDIPGVSVGAQSSLYRTEPQGMAEQPFFLNLAARLDCDPGVAAGDLLERMLAIELRLGRERDKQKRFGPRCIDLDLLLFGNTRMNTERLVLPHPRMLERAFVLVPLKEIAPFLCLPQGLTVAEALEGIEFTLDGDMIFQSPETGRD